MNSSIPVRLGLLLIALTIAAAGGAAGDDADRPDVLLADFEGSDYGDWTATGEAFGPGPARGALPGQMAVAGYRGEGLVNTFRDGDGTRGTLTSPSFDIERRYVVFLIGGGNHPGRTSIDLLVDGETARTATGANDEHLELRFWDVGDLAGKPARLRIVDEETGGWGHINVDHIVLTDTKPDIPVERERLLARAEESVRAAAARAASDPTRPVCHFVPLAQWMNDPNGTIFHDGWYHVFFQHNPYGDNWGHMHWGHTRSRDLVHWERLPIALWPSKDRGEDHVFSGCAWRNAAGTVMLFYTSVGGGRPNEQWAAVPRDDGLIEWDKHAANPLVTVKLPDGRAFGNGMRDPFIFERDGRTFMVVGADLGDEAVVPIFEAADGSLASWEYRGIAWSAPQSVMRFPECPNFFPLGDHWVLLNSPYRPVEYRVGAFDLETLRFREVTQGRVDESGQYYATNIALDESGRCVLFGWVRGFKGGRGWNGCLALPRVLTIGDDGRPRQMPVPELAALRGRHHRVGDLSVRDGVHPVDGVRGDTLELRAEIERGTARRAGLRVRSTDDGSAGVDVVFDGEKVTAAGHAFPFSHAGGEPLELRVFLDRSVLEVFVAGRACVTRVIDADPARLGVTVIAEGGEARVRALEAWELKPIW